MKIALLIFVSGMGLAWTWFFRPYGWFGQKIRFFGSTSSHPPIWPPDIHEHH